MANENGNPKPLPNPDKAKFKLLVYFNDGNRRVFYNYHTSYDAESKKVIINDKTALNKLTNLILFKYVGKYKTAILYHIETNRQIKRYVNGRLIFEAQYTFMWDKLDVLFQFKSLNSN